MDSLISGARARRILRDPLTHFLVAGALLFVWFDRTADTPQNDPSTIRLDVYEVRRLAALFHAQWQRPPDEAELTTLVADRIREEVLYREALALNLDKDDVLVRRRLADKLELALVDVVAGSDPDEDALRSYFERHRERYRRPAELSLTHVFWSTERRGDRAKTDAATALAQLRAGGHIDDDSFHASKTLSDVPSGRLTRVFGDRFREVVVARAARGADDSWFGPVASAYGYHLVRVDAFVPSATLPFEEVRDRVVEDWRRDFVDAEEARRYQQMLERYTIEVASLTGAGEVVPGP